MATKTPLLQRTALPENIKVATVSNEVIRRFKNTSRDLPSHVIEEIISDYMSDLLRGGFNKTWIANSVYAGVVGYSRMVEAELNGTGYINRPEHSTRTTRRFKRLCIGNTWYKGPQPPSFHLLLPWSWERGNSVCKGSVQGEIFLVMFLFIE